MPYNSDPPELTRPLPTPPPPPSKSWDFTPLSFKIGDFGLFDDERGESAVQRAMRSFMLSDAAKEYHDAMFRRMWALREQGK